MTAVTKPITAEELYAMGDIGRCELVKGEIIHMPPAGHERGGIALEIGRLISNFVKANQLGKAYAAETGFTISRNPDTTRAPDVGFVRKDRLPPAPKKGFFDGPPTLPSKSSRSTTSPPGSSPRSRNGSPPAPCPSGSSTRARARSKCTDRPAKSSATGPKTSCGTTRHSPALL